jgi:hypothetical protein
MVIFLFRSCREKFKNIIKTNRKDIDAKDEIITMGKELANNK